MTQITIPDNVPAWQLGQAMASIGLAQQDEFPPRFDWRQEQSAHAQCAHPGCGRDGAIRWGDEAVSWCSDHAWTQRGAA